jgi:phosphatidylglycerol:prolipoprotein diacylglycerol transferase
MLLLIDFPSWLKPQIIPWLPIRWYGLMYVFAFGTAFLLYRRQVRERRFPMSEDQLYSLFGWGILGLLLGARLFSALIYSGDKYFLQPWLIFWPFENGKFTGLMGMSYHGGAFCGLFAVIVFAKVRRFSFREIGDMFAAAIPLGYTFGRLGNFINAELYGRVTTGPLGMVFPHATPLSASDAWVREAAETALVKGKSPDTVKTNLKKKPDEDPVSALEKEKARLERTIETLSRSLEEVRNELKVKNEKFKKRFLLVSHCSFLTSHL